MTTFLRWFDRSVSVGNIIGTGGKAAIGRIGEARTMLATIRTLSESGKPGEACGKLQELYLRADGIPTPPDLLKGTDTRELLNRISALRVLLDCR